MHKINWLDSPSQQEVKNENFQHDYKITPTFSIERQPTECSVGLIKFSGYQDNACDLLSTSRD